MESSILRQKTQTLKLLPSSPKMIMNRLIIFQLLVVQIINY